MRVYYSVHIYDLLQTIAVKRRLSSTPSTPRYVSKNLREINLAEDLVDPLGRRPLCALGALLLDHGVGVQLPAAGDQVHVVAAHEGRAEVDLVADVPDDDDGRGEEVQEEVLRAEVGGHLAVSDGPAGGPELRH